MLLCELVLSIVHRANSSSFSLGIYSVGLPMCVSLISEDEYSSNPPGADDPDLLISPPLRYGNSLSRAVELLGKLLIRLWGPLSILLGRPVTPGGAPLRNELGLDIDPNDVVLGPPAILGTILYRELSVPRIIFTGLPIVYRFLLLLVEEVGLILFFI